MVVVHVEAGSAAFSTDLGRELQLEIRHFGNVTKADDGASSAIPADGTRLTFPTGLILA
jgi:hypothetical protein